MTAPSTSSRPTWLLIALTVWAVLQIPRLIAIPLIQSVQAGKDHPMWLIPAYGDVLNVLFIPFVIYLLWRRRGLMTWTVTLLWLALSIYDHSTTIVTSFNAPAPHAFEQLFGRSFEGQGYVAPLSQGIVDAVFLMLLAGKRIRDYFMPELTR